MSIDYSTLHTNPLRYAYLERDCRLLHGCLDKFYSLIESAGGEVAMTAPGTAMASFRRNHLEQSIPTNRHFPGCMVADCRGCLHGWVRRGYYGGRVEVYRERFDGPGTLNVGDVNSMYPWAMLGDVPTELFAVKEGAIDFERLSARFLGFVECTVEVPESTYIPALPYRSRGKLIFPTGCLRASDETGNGVWSSIELSAALAAGCTMHSVRRSVWFKGAPVFRSFVTHWYRYRDKSRQDYDEAMNHIAKLLLNSLYGKMGMTEQREKLWFFPTEAVMLEHELTPVADILAGVFTEAVEVSPAYVIPHIAAWVTSVARLRLYQILHSQLDAGHKVYYVDTDSVDTTGPVHPSSTLGELKLVGRASYCEYAAPKLYLRKMDDGTSEVRAKGFGGGFGAGKMTEELYRKVVHQRESVSIKKMTKLREGLRSGTRFPSMKTVSKKIHSLDTKRIHLGDGNTKPIHID